MDLFKCSLCKKTEEFGTIGYAGSYTDFYHVAKRCNYCRRKVCSEKSCSVTEVFDVTDSKYEEKVCLPCAKQRSKDSLFPPSDRKADFARDALPPAIAALCARGRTRGGAGAN